MKLRFIFVHFVLFRENVAHRNPRLHTYIKPYMQDTLLHLLASLTIIVSVDAVVVLVDYHFIHRVFFNIFACCESCTSLSFFSFFVVVISSFRSVCDESKDTSTYTKLIHFTMIINWKTKSNLYTALNIHSHTHTYIEKWERDSSLFVLWQFT